MTGRRYPALAAVGAVILVLCAGCGYTPRRAADGEFGEGVAAVGPAEGTQEWDRPCDGTPATRVLARLTGPVDAVSVTTCRPGPGDPAPDVSTAPDALLDAFVTAWSVPDPGLPFWSRGPDCTANLVVLGPVLLRTADGRALPLAVPVDVCGHPQEAAVQALRALYTS